MAGSPIKKGVKECSDQEKQAINEGSFSFFHDNYPFQGHQKLSEFKCSVQNKKKIWFRLEEKVGHS
jgi:hypothetical protein